MASMYRETSHASIKRYMQSCDTSREIYEVCSPWRFNSTILFPPHDEISKSAPYLQETASLLFGAAEEQRRRITCWLAWRSDAALHGNLSLWRPPCSCSAAHTCTHIWTKNRVNCFYLTFEQILFIASIYHIYHQHWLDIHGKCFPCGGKTLLFPLMSFTGGHKVHTKIHPHYYNIANCT